MNWKQAGALASNHCLYLMHNFTYKFIHTNTQVVLNSAMAPQRVYSGVITLGIMPF